MSEHSARLPKKVAKARVADENDLPIEITEWRIQLMKRSHFLGSTLPHRSLPHLASPARFQVKVRTDEGKSSISSNMRVILLPSKPTPLSHLSLTNMAASLSYELPNLIKFTVSVNKKAAAWISHLRRKYPRRRYITKHV